MKPKMEVHDHSLTTRLLAAGCPVARVDERADVPAVISIELNQPGLTKAYNHPCSAEYLFDIRVTNHSYVDLQIHRFECELDWDSKMTWQRDPRIHDPKALVYRLPSGTEFSCEKVLNHCTGRSGMIRPGESLKGVLVGLDMRRKIPFDYLLATGIPAGLSVFDQFGRRHRSVVEFECDRTALTKRLRTTYTGAGLYERDTSTQPRKRMNLSAPPAGSSSREVRVGAPLP